MRIKKWYFALRITTFSRTDITQTPSATLVQPSQLSLERSNPLILVNVDIFYSMKPLLGLFIKWSPAYKIFLNGREVYVDLKIPTVEARILITTYFLYERTYRKGGTD
jgi:hypothetical protein